MAKRYNLAYLVSHPIQYQAPLLRYITTHSEIDLTAFFLSDFSVRGYQDTGFGTTVQWDVPLLEGYKSVFLPALGAKDQLSSLRPLTYGLRHHLKAGNFDALWMHGYAHQANLRAMLVAKSLGMKVMLRAESQLGSADGTGMKRKLKEAGIRRIFANSDAFLAIGTLNREYYIHYGVPQEKIFSVPYAVDNCFFQAKVEIARPHREKLRASLGLQAGKPILLYASKFSARKRAGDVLKAYLRLSPDGVREPEAYLLFIGTGEEKEYLEAQARERGWSSIRFLGFKNQTELPAYFDLCDVFVLTSEREPWGLVVNEVMNAGKPIIVSDQVGAAPDLIKDGENGFVIPAGDISALTDRLTQFITQPEKVRAMGEASLNRIQKWSFQEDIAGLEAALHTIVGNRQ